MPDKCLSGLPICGYLSNSATSRALQDSPGSFAVPEKKGKEGSTEELESQEQLDIVKENDQSNSSRGREEEEEDDSTEIPDLPTYFPQVKNTEEITQELLPVYVSEVAPVDKDKEEIIETKPTENPTQDLSSVYSPEEAQSIEESEIKPTERPPQDVLPLYSPEKDPSVVDAEIDPTEKYAEKDPTESPSQDLFPLYSPEQAPSVEDPQGENNLTTETAPIKFDDRVSIILQNKY